jgi:hypothetical protein
MFWGSQVFMGGGVYEASLFASLDWRRGLLNYRGKQVKDQVPDEEILDNPSSASLLVWGARGLPSKLCAFSWYSGSTTRLKALHPLQPKAMYR